VVAAGLAFVTTLALKEKPLRAHFHAEQAARLAMRLRLSERPTARRQDRDDRESTNLPRPPPTTGSLESGDRR